MKLVFTHPSSLIVGNARNLLDQQGIACEMQNVFAGSAAGELSPIDAWPELWVKNDAHEQLAKSILANAENGADETWLCTNCGDENVGSFDFCWQCGTACPEKK
ncbi:putative signal transducing protein [Salinibius halmophilus]|uniref:putative signal transducing protein n=1 Tax=Salinibius halmophilus TaxID=1853216 RepID=UPI000E669ED3|nr:DUF2007 domain-containing protein [Salinibius halmophilus]